MNETGRLASQHPGVAHSQLELWRCLYWRGQLPAAVKPAA